jgi:hypothetical protein
MSDRLYFSCLVRGSNETNMLRRFEKLLDQFPFSKLAARGPVLRVYALEHVEPPVEEREFQPGATAQQLVAAAREFAQPDCSVEIEAAWDLWQYYDEWKLHPAAVTLACYGPRFDHEAAGTMCIDFGLDALFLPQPSIEGSLRMGQSNLRSLLSLVSAIEKALPLESRQLWSESGANFAEILSETLDKFTSAKSSPN